MKIYAPNADYTGVTAGVAFVNGEGEVKKDDHQRIAWFRERGFGIGKRSDAEDQMDHTNLKGSAKPLSELTRDELNEVALGKGVLGASDMKNKDEVIKAIEEAGGADSED